MSRDKPLEFPANAARLGQNEMKTSRFRSHISDPSKQKGAVMNIIGANVPIIMSLIVDREVDCVPDREAIRIEICRGNSYRIAIP